MLTHPTLERLIALGLTDMAKAFDDVLTVTRLDRLARSTRDLLNTLAAIIGEEDLPF